MMERGAGKPKGRLDTVGKESVVRTLVVGVVRSEGRIN